MEEQIKKDALEMGHRLLLLRTELKLSQEELSRQLGVSQRHVSEWGAWYKNHIHKAITPYL